MEIIFGILGSLSAIGIISLARWTYDFAKNYRKFLPYKAIWKDFSSKETCVVLTGREQGHTIKISFNEAFSADRILKLLKLSPENDESRITVANGDFSNLKNKNIIVLGSERVNNVTKLIMRQVSAYLNYSYTAENDLIINNEIFKSVYKNNILTKDFGLVVKTHNPFNPSRSVILFAGNHGLGTQAAVKALTEKSEAEQIVKEIGNSHFFAVIESHFDKRFSKNPIQTSIIRCSLLAKENLEKHNNQSLSKENEIQSLMTDLGANMQLIKHSIEVSNLAIEIGRAIENRGKDLDMDAIYYGAMLHDIGRIYSNKIDHGIKGSEILYNIKDDFMRRFYLTSDTVNKIIESIECHIVGGIKEHWIKSHSLGLPVKDYSPKSNEAKIVVLSDQILHSRGKQKIIFKEAPERDTEILANLYRSSEEIFLLLFNKIE